MTSDKKTGRRRTLTGCVVSIKMDKTVVVRVERLVEHSRYRKYVTRRKSYKAHDELNEFKIDDRVVIQECRPLSRTKRWKVIGRQR
jgi:small subunit ribosomal protein S17